MDERSGDVASPAGRLECLRTIFPVDCQHEDKVTAFLPADGQRCTPILRQNGLETNWCDLRPETDLD